MTARVVVEIHHHGGTARFERFGHPDCEDDSGDRLESVGLLEQLTVEIKALYGWKPPRKFALNLPPDPRTGEPVEIDQ